MLGGRLAPFAQESVKPRKHHEELAPSVQGLAEYVNRPENKFLRIYIGRMLDEATQKHPLDIKTPEDFFQLLDTALTVFRGTIRSSWPRCRS